jgi:tRNA(adenine34) deaminase
MPNPNQIDNPMDRAMELAHLAAKEDEVPVGAVIVHSGQIIGEGRNSRETQNDPCGHAEIQSIRAAAQFLKSWRLTDATLFVTLEPCPMCLAACQQARLSEVVYAAADPKGGALSLGYRLHEDLRTNHRFRVSQIADPRAEQVLKDFFIAKRKA